MKPVTDVEPVLELGVGEERTWLELQRGEQFPLQREKGVCNGQAEDTGRATLPSNKTCSGVTVSMSV